MFLTSITVDHGGRLPESRGLPKALGRWGLKYRIGRFLFEHFAAHSAETSIRSRSNSPE